MRGGGGDGAVTRRFLRQALEAEGHQVFDADSVKRGLIEALDARADDYLVKPFSVGELLARVRAILRRRDSAGAQATSLVVVGDCEIDLVKRQVRRHGEHGHLTPVEYKLAAALISRRSQVLSHRQLLREVWGPGSVEYSHYLRIYLGHLRKKLEPDPARPAHFLTETGVGCRFVAQPFSTNAPPALLTTLPTTTAR